MVQVALERSELAEVDDEAGLVSELAVRVASTRKPLPSGAPSRVRVAWNSNCFPIR